jgi:hypothetical protein
MNRPQGFRDNSTPKTGANAVRPSMAAIGDRVWTIRPANGITALRILEPAELS